jgi:hypothetical protein
MSSKLTNQNNQFKLLVLILFPAIVISLIIVTTLNLVGISFFAIFIFISFFLSATTACFYGIYTIGKIGYEDHSLGYNRTIIGVLWALMIFLELGAEVIGKQKIKKAQGNVQKSIFYTLLVTLTGVTPFVMIFTLLVYLFFS